MEGFISKIFRKSYSEILLSDVEEFFKVPQEETGVLEFKSGEVSLEDIFKEVAAFLNTEGGLIIIGAPKKQEEKINTTQIKEIYQGDLTYSKFRNKDWLYQKIASNIIPTSTAVMIKEFLIPDKGGVFLIDVPQSSSPPHQVESEGKYYIRMDRIAKPAPHGLVQALFNKRRLPKLVTEIELKNMEPKDRLPFKIKISNNSNQPADKVGFIISLFNAKTASRFFEPHYATEVLNFTYSNHHQGVLVRNTSIHVDLEVSHDNREFLIWISYWSKERDYDFDYYHFRPRASFENVNELLIGQRDFSVSEEESTKKLWQLIGSFPKATDLE